RSTTRRSDRKSAPILAVQSGIPALLRSTPIYYALAGCEIATSSAMLGAPDLDPSTSARPPWNNDRNNVLNDDCQHTRRTSFRRTGNSVERGHRGASLLMLRKT